jgi:glycosyltransferase involved in cell wall biosynthesis
MPGFVFHLAIDLIENGLAGMGGIKYSTVIRTFNSEKTLAITLDSLKRQTLAPSEYIFVDSGSTDGTLDLLPADSVIHNFVGAEFNYAEALNQGISYVSTAYVLIISSHTALGVDKSIEFALDLLRLNENIGAAYFDTYKQGVDCGALRYELIDESNFDGFCGLSNSCSIIKVPLLRKRGFRPEVFTAEDQEWAKWLFLSEKKAVARISGSGALYNNPRKESLRKRLNEYVSVAYYTNRDLLGCHNIAKLALCIFKQPEPRPWLRLRLFHLVLCFRLIACHFVKPTSKSRYF